MSLPFSTDNPNTAVQNTPVLVIEFGTIAEAGGELDEAALYKDGDSPGIFTDYIVRTTLEDDRHIYMMGQTSPEKFQGKTVGFVQLASHTILKIVDWTACKALSKPKIPDPTPSNDDWILLDVIPETYGLSVTADGTTPVFRISGVYVYGHTNPPDSVFDLLEWPSPPWLDSNGIDRSVSKNLFDSTIVDSQAARANAGNGPPLFRQG